MSLPLLVLPLGRAGLVLAGCLLACPTRADETPAVQDPLEPANRVVFEVNMAVDRFVMRPIATGYQAVTPEPVRTSVGHFFDNLGEPTTLVNDVLQANPQRAWTTTQRFAVNTTIGVGGLFDAGTGIGLPRHQADFGQTLGVWGVPPGPAVQLPLFGPSNLRDAAGRAVDSFASPSGYIGRTAVANIIRYSTTALRTVDGRSRRLSREARRSAPPADPYVALRDRQAREREAFVAEGLRSRNESHGRAVGVVVPGRPQISRSRNP